MSKLQLNPAPTFKAVVPVPVPGGEAAPVTFEFRHRTRDALAEWLKVEHDDAEAVLGMGVAWDLAEPFDAENVGVLVQNYIGVARVVLDVYIKELTKARLGN